MVAPHFLARSAINHHSEPVENLPGTGGQLAKHLVEEYGLTGVVVEQFNGGDHYDPKEKAVRLSSNSMNGKSLSAIAVAAHEFGHALQDYEGYPPLRSRTKMVAFAQQAEKIGSVAMLAIPVILGITRSPYATIVVVVLGLVSLGSNALVHLITLPVELDASFGRALPILKKGGYITGKDEETAVRKILKACAFTYLANSLLSMVNVWRWVTIILRR